MKMVSDYSLRKAALMIAMGFTVAGATAAELRGVHPVAAARSDVQANPLPVYELKLSAEEWQKLQLAPRSDERHPAQFTADGKVYPVDVRYRGDWARTWPKKPLKIFFAKDNDFEGQRTLNLNSNWRDPAFVREQLAYHIYAACNVPAPKTRMVKLNVNGQFHGVFLEVEQPGKPFLKRVGLKGAVLYKCDSVQHRSDQRDLGEESQFRAHYEKQTHKDEDYQDLQSFCHDLATSKNIAAFFNEQVDVERYVNYLAGSALVQNWDWYSKNHVLVRDADGSKKWLVVPWDLDRTLGDHWMGPFNTADLPLRLGTRTLPAVIGWNRLYDAFYNDPSLQKLLLDRLEVLLQKEFTEARLFPLLDRWEAEIGADVALDRKLWPNPQTEDLHAGIAVVKQYIKDRRAFLTREIKLLRATTAAR